MTTVPSEGDRDSSSVIFSIGYEGTDAEATFTPFALASLSYIHQDSFDEQGFPFFKLQFDSRDTWWLNLEGGVKWEKVYETDEAVDYHLQLAGVLSFLTNIIDETQYFTYSWGATLGIGSSGESEPGIAFRFGLKRQPKDVSKMRIEVGGSAGYQAEELTYSALLSFIFPFGDKG